MKMDKLLDLTLAGQQLGTPSSFALRQGPTRCSGTKGEDIANANFSYKPCHTARLILVPRFLMCLS